MGTRLIKQLQLEFWKIGNTIFWSLNAVILLTIILDILILSRDWLNFVLLKLFLLVFFYVVYRISRQRYRTPNMLIHIILFSFNFMALITMSETGIGNRLMYTTLIVVLFVSFNTIAVWAVINSFIQYLLVIATFSLLVAFNVINDPVEILKQGGYVFLSLGFVSLFFPKTRKTVLVEKTKEQLNSYDKTNDLIDELSTTRKKYEELLEKVLRKENEFKFLFQQISDDLNKINEALADVKNGVIPERKKKVDKLDSLIQNLRNQSSIYFKPINLNATNKNFLVDSVDVKKVYLGVLESFKTSMEEKSLRYTEELIDANLFIEANERMFNTVVYNILNFVVMFSNNNDEIKVSLENIDRNTILSVSNKTHGIDTSEIESYFRDVEYVNYDYKKHNDSVKIGLRISKQLTEKMNGYFSYVSSETMGFELKIQFHTYKQS